MAGMYPDAPAPRMAWYEDGSAGFAANSTIPTNAEIVSMSASEMIYLNEHGVGYTIGNGNSTQQYMMGVKFPQLRNLTHYYIARADDGVHEGPVTIETSANTVTGADGTWTVRASNITVPMNRSNGLVTAGYRSPTALAVNGIRAIRIKFPSAGVTRYYGLDVLHLYGHIASGQTPDRLALWHPTLDQPLSQTPAHFDFGDISRANAVNTTVHYTKTFRVKNLSSTKTANNPRVAASYINNNASHSAMWSSAGVFFTPSNPGGFQANAYPQIVSSLAPGEISDVCTYRIALGTSTLMGLSTASIIVSAASYS